MAHYKINIMTHYMLKGLLQWTDSVRSSLLVLWW